MKVILIIPAYNEEGSIVETVHSVMTYNQNSAYKNDYTIDYVVINDGSSDNTAQILKEHRFNHINLLENLGIGGAVQTGYKYALANDYDIAIQFDGDGQHDIESVDNIIQPVANGETDFCIGSRFIDTTASEFQTTFMRRFGIKLISFLLKLVTKQKIYDVTSGYRAANKKTIKLFSNRYPTNYPEPESIVHLIKNKLSIKECPVNMKERTSGTSSITSFKSVKYMIEVGTLILISSFMKEGE